MVKLIKAGQPVFFGCDVGQFSDRDAGIMDPALFEYEVRTSGTLLSCDWRLTRWFSSSIIIQAAFDITFGLSKADRLRVNESSMTHAMVITAVHLDASGKPVRYKVENSWGDTAGDKGWFVMSDKWFEE